MTTLPATAERKPIPQFSRSRASFWDDEPDHSKIFGRNKWRIFLTDNPEEKGRIGVYRETCFGSPMFYFGFADCELVTKGYYAPITPV